MEASCCGGIEFEVRRAVENNGKAIPCETFNVSREGKISC